MHAIAIHSPGEVAPASRLRRSLRFAVAALLSVGLVVQPAWAQDDPSPPAGDALARYQARHANAVTIERELRQRVAALEQQEAVASARSAQLQLQLGDLLKRQEANDAAMRNLQGEISGKASLVGELNTKSAQLQQQRRDIQAKIDEYERIKWMCYIPFVPAPLICAIAGVFAQRDALDRQQNDVYSRLGSTQRELEDAQGRLHQLQDARGVAEAERSRVKGSIDGTVQQLKVLHAELARGREAHQRHRVSLDSFSAELKQVETLPPSERASVIERRMNRLDAQLASEMGQACHLFTGGGAPLPEPVRQACALG